MKRFLIKSNEVALRLESRESGFSWFDGRILDAAGFLVYSEVFTFLKTLPEVAEADHAILIAEGGMGKTFILEEFRKSFSNDEVEKIDLARYGGNVHLLGQDIENGAKKKFLLIDGVDEADELCPTLLLMLTRTNLKAHVIIASRSIPPLKALCEELKWPVFSLLPYTRDDVHEICKAGGKDFFVFMREVEGRGLGGVCAKPLGCKMLLSSFDGKKLMYTSSEDMWHRALMCLCAENDCSPTITLKKDSHITANEGWSMAIRVALILKLSGHSVITRISSFTGLNEGAIDFSRIIPSDEYVKFNECLLRPIFMPIEHNRFRFAHSSYFDFMAAMGIIEYVDVSEWMKIVLSQDGVPFPQWEGAISWLAARDGVLLERVKTTRPDLLLGSDAVAAKIGVDEICKAILKNAESIPATIRENPAIQARYYALSTDGCVQILADVLKNSCSEAVLDTAIDIIRRARVVQMVDSLVEFFCDDAKDISLRVSVGYALLDLADSDQRAKCRTLLSRAMPKRLKGLILRLLWPNHMTGRELIPFLTPSEDGVFDVYEHWLENEFPLSLDALSEEDMCELLRWAITDLKRAEAGEHHFFAAKLSVFIHCWLKTSSQKELELLARGLADYADICFSPFSDRQSYEHIKDGYGSKEYIADVTRRRRMACFIVEHECLSLKPLTSFCIQLLQYNDIDFMIDAIKSSNVPCHRKRWVECLARRAGGIELPARHDVWDWLHQEFPVCFNVDAKTALRERRKYEREIQSIKRRGQLKSMERERKQSEVYAKYAAWAHEKLLDAARGEQFAQVMNVVYWQTPKGGCNFGLDFRKSALWPTFSEQELTTLIDAAYDFILKCNGPWSKANEYHPSYVQAFYLLMAYDQERLKQLPPEAWRKFAPELLQALNYDTFDLVSLTLKYFSERQPRIFFEELAKVFRKQLAAGQTIELYKFKEIMGTEVVAKLLVVLDSRDISSEQRRSLYDEFWRIDSRVTADHINASFMSGVSLRECEFQTSVYLIVSAPEKRFPELLAALYEDTQWGRAWAEQILGQEDYHHCTVSGVLCRCPVGVLKEFYQWLIENFPMGNVYQFISRVFNELVSRPDIELPQMLDDLSKRFPHLRYLRDWTLRARRNLLEKDCPTYDIDTIKQVLLKRKNGTFVNTPDDLLAVVCEVLKKYQTRLTGRENPRIECLWNTGKAVTHKDEAAFSNDIKSYMDLVLPNVVVNREVKLSSASGDKPGAITDIWVTAISKTDDRRIRLCIEVKGSWNRECKTSFKNQLCEKYMGEGGADAGIFLVGWFYSELVRVNRNQWKDKYSAERFLREQEDCLSKQEYKVKSIVIDCTY